MKYVVYIFAGLALLTSCKRIIPANARTATAFMRPAKQKVQKGKQKSIAKAFQEEIHNVI